MAQIDNRYAGRVGARTDVAVDEGLRAYMLRVYNYMAAGVALTGLVAYVIFTYSVTTDPALAATRRRPSVWPCIGACISPSSARRSSSRPLKWVVMLAPLGFVFFLSWRIYKMSVGAAQLAFWLFAAVMGASLSSIFLRYTATSITQVFFVTAAAFGALSLYGYTTQRDLSGWGSFLIMGVIGIIVAGLLNIWLQSGALQFAISVIGVLVFAGLTAYDTQQIKDNYYSVMGDATATAKAVHHGRAQPLPRLHQHVRHVAPAVRQSRISGEPSPSREGPASAGPFAFGRRLGQFRLAPSRSRARRCSRRYAPPPPPTFPPSPPSIVRPSCRARPASSWSRRARRRCCAASRPSPTPAIPTSSPSSTAALPATPTPTPIARGPPIASRWRIPSTSPPMRRAKASAGRCWRALIDTCTAQGFRLMVAIIGDSANFASITLHRRAGFTLLRHHPLGRLQVRPLARQRHHGAAARRGRHVGSCRAAQVSALV